MITQILSRLKHIKEIRALRFQGDRLEVRHPESQNWLPAENIVSFQKQNFIYADPWRPFTVGYPGIEIRLKDVSSSADDLFAYGMEKD